MTRTASGRTSCRPTSQPLPRVRERSGRTRSRRRCLCLSSSRPRSNKGCRERSGHSSEGSASLAHEMGRDGGCWACLRAGAGMTHDSWRRVSTPGRHAELSQPVNSRDCCCPASCKSACKTATHGSVPSNPLLFAPDTPEVDASKPALQPLSSR